MSKRLIGVAALGVILSVVFVGTAQAEQCSSDGKICLVTDTSQPLLTPTTLQFRVTSEATSFGVSGASGASRLVEPGPPGGMGLWETPLGPVESDGSVSLSAGANGPGLSTEATFSVPVLTSVVNPQARIVRQGKRFVAEVSYDGRTTVRTAMSLILAIAPEAAGNSELKWKKGPLVTRPAGHQVIRLALRRRLVLRLCRKYPYCKLTTGLAQYVPLTPSDTPGAEIDQWPPIIGSRIIKRCRPQPQCWIKGLHLLPHPKHKHHRK